MQARHELEKIKVDAQQKVAQAEAEAVATKARADADAYATSARARRKRVRSARGEALKQNADLVNLRTVEKWSGILSQTIMRVLRFRSSTCANADLFWFCWRCDCPGRAPHEPLAESQHQGRGPSWMPTRGGACGAPNCEVKALHMPGAWCSSRGHSPKTSADASSVADGASAWWVHKDFVKRQSKSRCGKGSPMGLAHFAMVGGLSSMPRVYGQCCRRPSCVRLFAPALQQEPLEVSKRLRTDLGAFHWIDSVSVAWRRAAADPGYVLS